MEQIFKGAEDAVAAIFSSDSQGSVSLTASNGDRPSYCKPSLHKFALYMSCLASVGLWPWRADLAEDPSVEETLEQLAEVAREQCPGKCGARLRTCGSCSVDIGVNLARVVEKHKKALTSLCLKCVQNGNCTDEAFRTACP
jgi:hypothetical protein